MIRVVPSPVRRATLALALAVLASAGAVSARKGGADLEDWIDGPVKYIALREEVLQFRALQRDSDRAVFVEKFWARRDPDPETMVNEYRTLFWERVKAANDTILDAPRPGWMTDRGKIYILYGPPNEIQDMPRLETDASATSSRGLIRWIYERPGGRRDVDAIVVVPFVRDVTGEYRISYDPKLASVFLDEWAIRDKRQQRFDRLLTSLGGIARESELSVMLDLGKMQEVPPAEKVLLERVETFEQYRAEPLDVRIDRFRHPDRPGTLCSVSLRLPTSRDDERPAILARFRPADGGDERILDEIAFKYAPDERGGLVAQARIRLEPGTWSALVVAVEPYSAETSIWRGTVVATEESADLALSDVLVAERIEPVEVRALATWDEPFHLGPYRAVPRVSGPVPPGRTLELLFEIYGGVAPYSVAYRLEGREHDGRWIALGRPAVREDGDRVQGWQLPVGTTWPLGEYRVQVEVTDSEGTVVDRSVPFRVAPVEADESAGRASDDVVPVSDGS